VVAMLLGLRNVPLVAQSAQGPGAGPQPSKMMPLMHILSLRSQRSNQAILKTKAMVQIPTGGTFP